MTDKPQAKWVRASGVDLCQWNYPGSGARVLFLHGFLDTGRSFEPVLDRLNGSISARCLDWRGHGGSRPIPASASFHQLDHFKDLVRVVGQETNDGPDLIVAHSLGAVIAFLFAAACPGRCKRFLLLDGCGGFKSEAKDQSDALSKLATAELSDKPEFRQFDNKDAAIRRVCQNNPGLSEAGARHMVEHATELTTDGSVRFKFDARLRGPNPTRFSEAVWRDLASRIEDKAHVLLGERGMMRRAPGLVDRIDAIPGSSYEVVPDVAHHLHLDAPDAVADAIRRLLDD